MNSNPRALEAALLLLGESKSSIADATLFRFQPLLSNRGPAWMPERGESSYVPSYRPEWANEQHQQDLLALQQFAWERLSFEILKAQRLEQQHPELLKDADFLAYQKTVAHAIGIVSGNLCFVAGRGAVRTYEEPNLTAHRIGSWPEQVTQ